MVHSPGFWATADAASTTKLAAMPDSSLNRFIADLVLSDEDGVKVFHTTLPVACEHLRASRGSTFPTGPTHTGLPSMQIPTGELGYIPGWPHCQSGSKAPLFQGETGGAPRVTRAPRALKPPSYTTPPAPPPPPAPSTVRARAVIACDSSAVAVMPYTAGP